MNRIFWNAEERVYKTWGGGRRVKDLKPIGNLEELMISPPPVRLWPELNDVKDVAERAGKKTEVRYYELIYIGGGSAVNEQTGEKIAMYAVKFYTKK